MYNALAKYRYHSTIDRACQCSWKYLIFTQLLLTQIILKYTGKNFKNPVNNFNMSHVLRRAHFGIFISKHDLLNLNTYHKFLAGSTLRAMLITLRICPITLKASHAGIIMITTHCYLLLKGDLASTHITSSLRNSFRYHSPSYKTTVSFDLFYYISPIIRH